MDGKFENRMMKLAMVLATAVEAKTENVAEMGIGEDLNQVLYGWKGSKLVVLTQMTDSMQRESHEARFMAVSGACAVLRQGWGVDSLSMVAEGYVSNCPSETDGKKLHVEFANGNPCVKEAITITHVAGEEISFVTKSYSYTTPRKVVWDEEVFEPGRLRVNGQEGMYPLMFSKALELPVDTPRKSVMKYASDDFYGVLITGLVGHGFQTKSFV